ncbi:Uncharacterised protein [Bordetella ansorpii]|uniref:Uncharacterized protein n=1 Tax=Bordetella ansorpii TaxID=288768 RepID=A0A157SCU4_9BORD|nr:Uncharacterised protein [Bordetella ansorpii]
MHGRAAGENAAFHRDARAPEKPQDRETAIEPSCIHVH